MNRNALFTTQHCALSRRQLLSVSTLALCRFFAPPFASAERKRQTMKQIPSSEANRSLTSLHQEIDFNTSLARIYGILLNSREFAAFTGMPAEIDAKEGGAFSMFGAMIVGRNIELLAGQRIVQAWRPASWESGVYSIVKFELKPKGTGTLVVLDHTGFPEGDYDHLFSGWGERYWNPLHKYLA